MSPRQFGGLTALTDVSFVLNKDEILGLIGPNGAGKTTMFNVINGFYRPTKGDVFLNGKRVTKPSDLMYFASWVWQEHFRW